VPARHEAVTRASFLALSLLVVSAASGAERLQRKFDLERGLPFSEITSLAQDTRGFIWIGTTGGLFRYDGVEVRPWPRGTSRVPGARGLAAGPGGEVVFLAYTGTVYEVAGETTRPLQGPDGEPLIAEAPPVFDRSGQLWVATADRLWIRRPGPEWHEFPLAPFRPMTVFFPKVAEDGSVVVITDNAIWAVDGVSRADRLASMRGIQAAVVRADGSVVVLLRGSVVELRDGTRRELFRFGPRPIDMVQRGRTLWIGYDSNLVALAPNRPPEILGPRENVASGAALLVDREGSLWVGTYRGLLQFPEPETVAFGDADGMSGNGVRRLALASDGIWADSWNGLNLLRKLGDSWRPESVPDTSTAAICATADGTLWTGHRGGFLERRGGRFVSHPRPDLEFVDSCAAGAEGRVWMYGNLGLAVAGSGPMGSTPRIVSEPAALRGEDGRVPLLEDSSGQLWLAKGEEICHADAREAATGNAARWSCTRTEGVGRVTSLVELSSGSHWAATLASGVHRLGPSGLWEPIPGSRDLPTPLVRALRSSPSGGAWVISFGTILRAVEQPETAEGWEIVERPLPWHGLMISDAEDLLEDSSGDLWISTLVGLVHISAAVRGTAPPVPPVELVDVLVDGEPLPWKTDISLPYRRNRVELRFAGLSYRDPALLRYQVRLKPDVPWRDASGRPQFQFVDVPPGEYHAEVRASLDGRRWSEPTARVSFTVLPPFWRTWWFNSLAVLGLAAVAYALYRFRLAHLLGVERVRTRIAADLHDDIGASLSRIALQSELLRRPESSAAVDAERLLADIAESARALVGSMGDIVWSIDPRRDDLSSVIARVRQFALEIMEPRGIALELVTPPAAGELTLAPEARRHLYLLLKEALHNVVKHAGCRSVRISLTSEGAHLRAEVKDDGHGFPVSEADRDTGLGGHGFHNMRSRASQIGGTLDVRSSPGQGTVLTLTVPVRHEDA